MMMPWLILGILNSSFFRIDTVSVNVNGDNARELGRSRGGLCAYKVTSGVFSLVVKSPFPKVQFPIFQHPLTPAQEIVAVRKISYV